MNTKNSQNDFVFIIPTYTNTQGLRKTLKLLSTFYSQIPVAIINNNNAYKLEIMFNLAKYPNKKIVVNNSRNEGFAKACNKGAQKANESFNPKYFIFLNDDVEFKEDWVSRCIDRIKNNHWVATTPILMNFEGEIENVGYSVLPFGKAKLIKKLDSKESLDGISATALVFEKTAFFKLKGFDENFFAYLEDVDLFLRARKAGMKFGITKEAKIFHEGQATSSKMKPKKAFLDFRNWILVIAKNWSREEILKNFPAIFIERLRNLWGFIKSFF